MSDGVQLPPSSGATEFKVKAAAFATFVASTIGITILQSTVTDMVPALPDWLESPAYGLVLAVVTWLAGYAARTKPSALSQSTVDAFQEWLKKRLPHQR